MLLSLINSALLREWTVQKSLIVDRTHLALAHGKLVLQKKLVNLKIAALSKPRLYKLNQF